jgi:hypothetical protein
MRAKIDLAAKTANNLRETQTQQRIKRGEKKCLTLEVEMCYIIDPVANNDMETKDLFLEN